jgi:hypothetical protein
MEDRDLLETAQHVRAKMQYVYLVEKQTGNIRNDNESCLISHFEVQTHLTNLLLLLGELGRVVIVDDLKGLATISEVARVDANLFERLSHSQCNLRLEVDICYKRHIIPAQGHDHLHNERVLLPRNRDIAHRCSVRFILATITCICGANTITLHSRYQE